MNHLHQTNTAQLNEWIREMDLFFQQLTQSEFPLDVSQLYEEHEVCKLLRITPRTMLTYRKRNYFHYIKLEGRVYYLKPLLYIELVKLSMNHR